MWTPDNKWLPSSERGRQMFKWGVWIATPIVVVFIVTIGVLFGWKQG